MNNSAIAGAFDTPEHETLADLMPIGIWLEEKARALFTTPEQWAWFCRAHKVELVESGALLLGSGRRSDYATGALEGRVRAILVRESLERLKASRKLPATAE